MYLLLGVILVLTAIVYSANVSAALSNHRTKRNTFQFGSMVLCTTNRNPLDFADYGCYCGFGGEGVPVDGLDECCKIHDECWRKVTTMTQGRGKNKQECGNPGLITYTWKSKCKKTIIKCRGRRKTCAREACECDRAAALCFANNVYIDEHYDLDLDLCFPNDK